ncbi:peroxiredoxin, partial [Staphylococcus aureus]|nr:peroxiredoxin [Staphylococcus aureus]
NNGKFSMSKLVHHPQIQIPRDQIAHLEKRFQKLITIAYNNCMISNAVRNYVEIKIYPIIQAK